MSKTPIARLVLAAALLVGAGATAASAEPDPPHGGPCYVYWDPFLASGIPGVPDVKKPRVSCLY